jgi:hypothetical protein
MEPPDASKGKAIASTTGTAHKQRKTRWRALLYSLRIEERKSPAKTGCNRLNGLNCTLTHLLVLKRP